MMIILGRIILLTMTPSLKRLLSGIFALSWITLILVLYFAGHKPFTLESAPGLALLLWRLVSIFLLISLSGGLGGFFLKRTSAPSVSPLLRMAIQAGLGLGALALGVLLVGMTLGIPRWFLLTAPLVLLGLVRREVLAWWRLWSDLGRLWREGGAFGRAAGVLLGIGLAGPLWVALAPPVQYDALVYHLTMPAAYLRAGRVEYLPWIIMTGLPQVAEMLYTLAGGMAGLPAAAGLGWGVGPLAVTGLLGWLSPRFGARAAWAGAAAWLAGYSTLTALAWGYVDWWGALFGLGCLAWLDAWTEQENPRWLIWAGVFAGLAFGAKYTAGNLLITAGLALLWQIWKRRAALLPNVLRFGVPFGLVALPWLVKNLITTGNPLYPFFFVSGALSPVRLPIFQNAPSWGDWRDVVLLPLRATVLGLDGAEGYEWSVGPLLLGLAALAWVGRREFNSAQRRMVVTVTVAALAGWLVWAVGNLRSGYLIQTRMVFTVFPAFAALAAIGYWGVQGISAPPVRFGRILSALILFVLALNTLQVWQDTLIRGSLPAAFGLSPETDYLERNLGWFARATRALHDLPDGSHVLLLYEPRSLYCAPICAPDEILDRWKRDWLALGDPARVLASWRAEGFTHILVSKVGWEYFLDNPDIHHPVEETRAFARLLDLLDTPQDFGGVYNLYTVEP